MSGAGRPPPPGRVRRIFVDLAPLRRDRDYRWLWSGQVVNGIGNQITRIALPYQVYVLTGSTLAIAALTLFQLIPILLFALGAGTLADAVDRRRLLLATQAGLAACSLTLSCSRSPAARRSPRSSRSRSSPPGCRRSTNRRARLRSHGSSRPSVFRRPSHSTGGSAGRSLSRSWCGARPSPPSDW